LSLTVVNNRAHIAARWTANVAVLPPMEMFSRRLMECFNDIASQQQIPVSEMSADNETEGDSS
jgi:hypothetical protein